MVTDNLPHKLLAWYDAAKRDLPWRHTSDPYAILVSELMLQQTQVKTVIPYYHRFLERFPTAKDLANASEEVLLKMWQGLGYYRRARHLQAAAVQVVEDHGGVFPSQKEDIDALKGVGTYTSAAVASIAFGLPYACVDGNVIRVVTRLRGMDDDVVETATKHAIQGAAQEWINLQPALERPGDFNQAMMELGATICTPRKPGCLTCPLSQVCSTFQNGDDPERRPVKTKKVKVSRIDFESLFFFSGNRFLLARRPSKGLMAGMWELPAQVKDDFMPWPELFEEDPDVLDRLDKPFQHRFTHLHAFYHLTVLRHPRQIFWRKPPTAYAESRWIGKEDFAQLPVTKVLLKMLPELTRYLEGQCPPKNSPLPGMPITT